MIRYALQCENGHKFESWFSNAAGFDTLKAAGHLSCAVCGSPKVEKALMAPKVSTKETPDLSAPLSAAEQAMAEMRRHVEENADDVGTDFARQARAIQDGEMEDRAIYGQANADDAKALVDDGVPIAPLPFIPNRKAN